MKQKACSKVLVRVYLVDPPLFNKRRFSYSKRFCSIEEAQEHIELCKMADVNFNNFMGYCKRARRFFKMVVLTEKKRPLQLQYIKPRYALQ